MLVIVGGTYYFLRPQTQSTTSISTPTISLVDRVALSQLQNDLHGITPHFIDASKANGQSLTPTEQRIKDDIVALFTAGQAGNMDYYSQLWLNAVGRRYVLASQPSSGSSYDVIIDSQTGKNISIQNGASYLRFYFSFEGGKNAVLYVGDKDVYTYTLDQSSFVLVQNSVLLGRETYHSGRSDFMLDPELTHTDDSTTISVFDSLQAVQNPKAQKNALQTMYKKIRDVVLQLP